MKNATLLWIVVVAVALAAVFAQSSTSILDFV
jgi:hypothetical protein